jgi:hypothetical protein
LFYVTDGIKKLSIDKPSSRAQLLEIIGVNKDIGAAIIE